MERNHHHHPHHHNHQQVQQLQPYDFFFVPNDHHLKESSSSSSWVSTELSLSTTTNKKSSSSSNLINPSSPSNTNNNDGEWGFSTTLKLYDDPWKIKKVLTTSDLGKLNRLLLTSDWTGNLMAAALINDNNNTRIFMHQYDHQRRRQLEESLLVEGKAIKVWDVETRSIHKLILKRWTSFMNYVLIGDWNQDFVKRRRLKKGDEIGLQWDSYNHRFNFSVLKRAQLPS